VKRLALGILVMVCVAGPSVAVAQAPSGDSSQAAEDPAQADDDAVVVPEPVGDDAVEAVEAVESDAADADSSGAGAGQVDVLTENAELLGGLVGQKVGQRAGLGAAGIAGSFDAGQAAMLGTVSRFDAVARAQQLADFKEQMVDYARGVVGASQSRGQSLAATQASAGDVTGTGDGEVAEDASFFVRTRLQNPERLARTGGAAHRFGEEDLEALEYDDPTAILLQVPGVAVRQEDGFGLRPNIGIRGATAERSKKITLMEDGILFAPAPYSAPAAYYFPIVSRMIGVEVFKGPAGVRFGPHTVGGAVNWVSRDIPGKTSGGFDVNAGSYFTGKAHGWFGSSNDWGGFLVEGVQWQSNGFKELDDGGNTGFRKTEFMAKGRLNTDPAARVYNAIELKLGYSQERSEETYVGLTDADFAENPYRRYPSSALDNMEWWRTQAELRHRLEVGNELVVENVVYRNDFQRDWFKLNRFADGSQLFDVLLDPTGRRGVFYDILRGAEDTVGPDESLRLGNNGRQFASQGVQSTTDWRVKGDGWANSLEVGARLHMDWIERFHTERNFQMIGGELQREGDERFVTADNRGEATALALHVLDQVDIGDLSFSPGLRFEHIVTTFRNELTGGDPIEATQTVLIPGAGAYWEFVDTVGVLAGVNRGFSPAAPGNDPNLSPETSVNYEAGVRHFDAESGQLIELVGFFSDYSNFTGQCTNSSGCDPEDIDEQFNVGEVDIYGAEAVVATAFGLPANWEIPMRLSYTLTFSEFRNGFDSASPALSRVEPGDELPYVPRHQGSLRVGGQHPDGGATLAFTYVSEMREEASAGDEGLRTDPYLMVDLLASYRVWGPVEVYGKVENMLNAQPIVSRRPYGARPLRPFMAALGVRATFGE
jgi:Fe(3+) dicitrate transport protein